VVSASRRARADRDRRWSAPCGVRKLGAGVKSRSLQAKLRRLRVSHRGGSRRRIRQRRITSPLFPQLLHTRPRGTRRPGSTPALQPIASGGSAAEEVDQLASLPIGQTAERLRVSDPILGEGPAGSDRADLRHHHQDIADPRRPHTGGWVGEDLHQLDLSRSELSFQLRSRRPYLVRLLQRTQTLFARSARNARTGAALRHADDSAARTGRWSTPLQQTMRPPHPTAPTPRAPPAHR